MAALSRALVWIHAAGLHEVCSGSLLGRCGVCRLLRDLRLSARTGRRFHRLLTGTIETRGSLLGILLDGLSLLGDSGTLGLRYGIEAVSALGHGHERRQRVANLGTGKCDRAV